ncbi:MAG: hypothetical protein V1660_02130 [archaeon]
MNYPQIYIAISIIVLAIIAFFLFFANKKKKKNEKLSPLAGIAFAFIIAGIVFGDNRVIVYGLMGIGVCIAVVDIILKAKKR